MTNPKASTCCTCGYSWQSGRHGGHSCASELINRLKKIERLAFDNVGAKGHEEADLALVQIHAIAREVGQ
jgi:hypothetical protein